MVVEGESLPEEVVDDADGVREVLDLLGALVGELDAELLLDLHDLRRERR